MVLVRVGIGFAAGLALGTLIRIHWTLEEILEAL